MHAVSPFVPFVFACALGAYGWWCLFRTESAMDFVGRLYIGAAARSINYTITKLHGVLGFVFASILLFESIKLFLK